MIGGKMVEFQVFLFPARFSKPCRYVSWIQIPTRLEKTLQENSIFYFLQGFQNLVGMFHKFR
jgi:hypothetical protein